MSELNTATAVIKRILEEVPQTRNSDDLLFLTVCEEINPDVIGMTFENVILNRSIYGLPAFETVRRCRQKLQEKYPELGATERVKGFRTAKEEEFLEYARS